MKHLLEKWQSLRVRLVIFFGLLLFLLIATIVIIALSFIAVTEQTAWHERQAEATESAAQQVSAFMLQILNTLQIVAIVDPNHPASHALFTESLLTQNPALLEVTRLSKQGKLIASQARDESILAELFTSLQANWFRTAVAGETYIGDVQLSANESPYLIIALPGDDGGVVAARLQMSFLWQVIRQVHFGRNGSAYVVNRQGEIIAHSDAQLVIQRMSLASDSALAQALANEEPSWSGQYRNILGQPMVGVAKAIPGTPWAIVAELPTGEVTERFWTALILLIISGLVVIGGTLWATLALLKRTVFDPLERLRLGAERIGAGDRNQQITIKRQDEIGIVTHTFNEMVRQLRLHEEQLAANEAQLETALQRERQLGEMKTSFVRLMSHEFRTPLAVILSSNDLLKRLNGTTPAQKTDKYYTTISQQVHQLTQILDDFLLISQAQSVGLEFHPQLVGLQKLCFDVIEDFKKNSPSQPIICTELTPSGSLLLDSHLLHRALTNLLSNAAKYSPAATPIYVELQRNHHAALISVRDEGIGIPQADQPELFSVFHRGQNIDYRPGIGLGLAIVQAVVERHGGFVECTSQEGVGSTFTIHLPLPVYLPTTPETSRPTM